MEQRKGAEEIRAGGEYEEKQVEEVKRKMRG